MILPVNISVIYNTGLLLCSLANDFTESGRILRMLVIDVFVLILFLEVKARLFGLAPTDKQHHDKCLCLCNQYSGNGSVFGPNIFNYRSQSPCARRISRISSRNIYRFMAGESTNERRRTKAGILR